jgi:hypothetical protein
MKSHTSIGMALAIILLPQVASAQNQAAVPAAAYHGWQHSGSLLILTTPEGAELPASAVLEGFPLLVRLHRDGFDFTQAMAHGEDLRFASSTGVPLAYQIEEWDAARGTASIWVRMPVIKGNARQELKLYWGKPDAAGESNGKAVFNASNGYLSVWHMTEPVTDEVGTLESKDQGTTATGGMIGTARHFAGNQGIFGGDKIPNYPVGASPHSSEAWFRAETTNGHILAWGNQQAQGKVVMSIDSPPRVRVDAFFSGANVKGDTALPLSEWIHVVHTYTQGEAKIYVNGVLDGTTRKGSPLAVKSPARLWIGGWYHKYNFVGDIDEVRVSTAARPAEWVKLQYENQKPCQMLVGPLVQPGTTFAVAPATLTVLEDKSAVLTAQAGGAQKLLWILKAGGKETILATDRFALTFDAGRVTADQTATLLFKAVYPTGVKTREIPVSIKEDIPEPVFTLQAPAAWDGRTAIEIVPQVSNLAAMQAKGAGDLKIDWRVSGIAVIKEAVPGKLLLKRAQNSGHLTMTATISNGGKPAIQSITLTVTEPRQDPWVARTPAKDEQPEDGQFYARDDHNEGTLYYNGTLDGAADAVFLKVYADGKPYQEVSAKPAADRSYALSAKLKPGLVKYQVEFGTTTGGTAKILRSVTNLVCGDAYLIQGQSNALATDTREESPPDTSEWIRSYARPPAKPREAPTNGWCNPVWKAKKGDATVLGYWGMELAKNLVASQKIPVCFINGAVGGTRIDQHQRNPAEPADLTTIYGRALWRVRQARLTHGIRGILWHQGENNQGSASPTGDYDWKSYQEYFIELSAAWKQDFPNVQHYYVFQIWPNACSMAGANGGGDMIREIQRSLSRLYSNLSVMSTLGVKPAGGCHFPLAGWAEFARLIQPLIERDLYGKQPAESITPPDLRRAYFASPAKDAIVLEFDQPVIWLDALTSQFYLDGQNDLVASGSVNGSVLTLKLKTPATARHITYLKETAWNQNDLIYGANGIAALTFCQVPLEIAKPAP